MEPFPNVIPNFNAPPQAVLDAARDFFGPSFSPAKIHDAWLASQAQAAQVGRYGQDGYEPVHDTINYLLDTVSQQAPSPPSTPASPPPGYPIAADDHQAEHPSVDRKPVSVIDEKALNSDVGVNRKGKKRSMNFDRVDDEAGVLIQPNSGSKRHRHAHLIQVEEGPVASSSALSPQSELTRSEIAAKIYEIIPDVQGDYALGLYDQQTNNLTCAQDRIQHVINHLMEYPSYPRQPSTPVGGVASGSGAGPAAEPDFEDHTIAYERGLARWTSATRPDFDPRDGPAAISILAQAFPRVGLGYLRYALIKKRHLAPTWIFIEEQLEAPDAGRPVPLNKTIRKDGRRMTTADELNEEHEWLKLRQASLIRIKAEEAREKELLAMEEVEGLLLECQCCFDTFRFVKMIQCPEGHLFCGECVKRNADVQLGLNKADVKCMDASDCALAFPKAELAKALAQKVMTRLEQIEFEASIEQANIDGLEKCPFCVWAVIIENEAERVFRCGNQQCLKESCRKCKKPSHIPKTCEEVKLEESKSNSMHVVAEAMTEALIRKCPKCRQPFVKEIGCNKMRCMHCGTLSCYVCQQIVAGYEHFANAGTNLKGKEPDPKAKCPLWDDTNQRHDKEIEVALREANEKLQQSGSTAPGHAPLTAQDIKALRADPVPRAVTAPKVPAYFRPFPALPMAVPMALGDNRPEPDFERVHEQLNGLREQHARLQRLEGQHARFLEGREAEARLQAAQQRHARLEALRAAAEAGIAVARASATGIAMARARAAERAGANEEARRAGVEDGAARRAQALAEARQAQAGAVKAMSGARRRN